MEKSDQLPQSPCTLEEMRSLRRIIVNNIGGYQERSFDDEPAPPSRLLGLPAELRNRIYELLLDTGDLATAHPRILLACKQVYDEASGILYSGNTFTITISKWYVRAQGVRCGDYSPHFVPNRDITRLVWPPFVAKAQHLELVFDGLHNFFFPLFEVKHANAHGCRRRHGGWLSIVNDVLLSLCLFLRTAPMSRSVTVDLYEADVASDAVARRPKEPCTCFAQALRPLSMPMTHVSWEVAYAVDDEEDHKVAAIRAIGKDAWPEDAIPDLRKSQRLTRLAEMFAALRDDLGDTISLLPKSTRDGLEAVRRSLKVTQPALGIRYPILMDEEKGKIIIAETKKLEEVMQGLRYCCRSNILDRRGRVGYLCKDYTTA